MVAYFSLIVSIETAH